MEKKTKTAKPVEDTKEDTKLKGKGGAGRGQGRPKGGSNAVTVKGLLDALETRTGGATYEEVLMEDFVTARLNNDQQLVVKYHNLILNKLMTHVAKIEITDSQETINMKQAAFADALAKLAGHKQD
jgi:hypothetical protein